jgi:hypothetical protein
VPLRWSPLIELGPDRVEPRVCQRFCDAIKILLNLFAEVRVAREPPGHPRIIERVPGLFSLLDARCGEGALSGPMALIIPYNCCTEMDLDERAECGKSLLGEPTID